MTEKGRTLEQLIPEKLRELLQTTSKLSLAVKEFGHEESDKLAKLINGYYRRAYNLKPENDTIDLKTIRKALFGLPNGEIGFTKTTADILCKYAYQGDKDWKFFIRENPNLSSEFEFPTETRKKNKEARKSGTSPEVNEPGHLELIKYLKRKSKEFEIICLPIAKEETKINIKEVKPPKIRRIKVSTGLISQNHSPSEDENSDSSAIAIEKELETIERMLLIAEGGTGKTTLCKWLFHHYAHRIISKSDSTVPIDTDLNKIISHSDLFFPIYIDLNSEKNIESAIVRHIGNSKIQFDNIIQLLGQYIPLIICDGLDEVSDDDKGIIADIKKIESCFPDCRLLITSRESDYTKDFTSIGFPKYEIETESGYDLSELLIKDKNQLGLFGLYKTKVGLDLEINSNYLLYTFFILNFLRKGQEAKTKGEILKNILEYYYIDNWERADIKNRESLPQHFSSNYILNILSIIALVSDYKYLFTDHQMNGYSYNGLLLRTETGFTHQCLRNIITLCAREQEMVKDRLIAFYCESGMLVHLPNDSYKFSNKVIENYFSARAITKLCFEKESLAPFGNDSTVLRSLKHMFIIRRNATMEIVAGLIREPENILLRFYKEIPTEKFWKIHFDGSYIERLGFASVIIGVRNNEINPIVKQKVIEQLIFGFTTPVLKPFKSSLHKLLHSFLYSIAIIKDERFLEDLIKTKDVLAFDTIFNYFITQPKNSKELNRFICWQYFLLFPDNERLHKYCSDILLKHIYLNKDEVYRRQRLEYLAKYQQGEMVEFYLKALTAPDEFEETIFNEQRPDEFTAGYYSGLWTYIEGNKALSHKLADLVIYQVLNSHNKLVATLCYYFIYSCNHPEELFLSKVVEMMEQAKINNEPAKLVELLFLYLRIPRFNPETYKHYFLYTK